jgi:hypothetical protein
VERVYLEAERNFPILGIEEATGTMYRKALDIALEKIVPAQSGMLDPRIKAITQAGELTAAFANNPGTRPPWGSNHQNHHIPFTAKTGVRVPLGAPKIAKT